MENKSSSNSPSRKKRRKPLLRKLVTLLALFICLISIFAGALVCNNISFISNQDFLSRVDLAIAQVEKWVANHGEDILKKKNSALLEMLTQCNNLKPNPVFSNIISSFLIAPSYPACWKGLVDKNWPVDRWELNRTIKKEYIDNKWVLYAIAPNKAEITPEEMHLFDPQRWQGRQLTHQLDALIILRKTKGPDDKIDRLIEHLSERLSRELVFDLAVVDIYIQKIAFILRAGLPEKIRSRWIERIIANQLPDGGWNDRWFCFTSARRPVFRQTPPSNQHATIQALIALYIARYQYPECFDLE